MSDIYYAIPDIHGRKDLLDLALKEIFSRQDTGKIIFLGDYVDRGPDSGGVVRYLMDKPPEGWEYICLKGNHEDMLMYDVSSANELYDPKVVDSFGGYIDDEVLRWINRLKIYHIEDENIFVHADWDENLTENQQLEHAMIWHRRGRYASFDHPTMYLNHGHTPHGDGPVFAINRCNLDCGAFYTNRLCVGVYQKGSKGPITTFDVENRIV